jgi:hypothetical protein
MRQKRLRLLIATLLTTGLALAQPPQIGTIDFYGARKTSEATLRKALRVREGDPLPQPKADAEERLEGVPGVVRAHLEATCCEDGKAILYVGIEEKGAAHFDYRQPPTQELSLPAEIIAAYAKFLGFVEEAGRRGIIAEDLTNGHSLMAYPPARACRSSSSPSQKITFRRYRKFCGSPSVRRTGPWQLTSSAIRTGKRKW